MTETESILQVLAQYCHAIDDRRFDDLAALLTEDVRFDMGPDVTESRQALFDHMRDNLWPPGKHVCVNPSVTVDGAVAHAVSDWFWLDPKMQLAAAGRYEDKFRLEDGRWRISERRILFGGS